MKNTPLFPYSFRRPGWILVILGMLLAISSMLAPTLGELFEVRIPALVAEGFMDDRRDWLVVIENNLLDESIAFLVILGGLLVCFSREKQEDEFIAQLRLDALLWATYINYGLLLVALFTVYDVSFFYIMIANLFTLLFMFYIRFRYLLMITRKQIDHA